MSSSPNDERTLRQRLWQFLRRRYRRQEEQTNDDVVDNNNEVNSNYLPSLEPQTQRLYPDLDNIDFTSENVETQYNGNADDSLQARVYEEAGIYTDEQNDTVQYNQEVNENIIDAPDEYTESAQNEYNIELERIMQVCV